MEVRPFTLGRFASDEAAWSDAVFGTGRRTIGVTAHIRKELEEIEADPGDVGEWIDVIILAINGYTRHGGKPEELAAMLEAKFSLNMERAWPPIQPEDQPVEHLKDAEMPLSELVESKRREINKNNPGVAEWRLAEAGEPPFPDS